MDKNVIQLIASNSNSYSDVRSRLVKYVSDHKHEVENELVQLITEALCSITTNFKGDDVATMVSNLVMDLMDQLD